MTSLTGWSVESESPAESNSEDPAVDYFSTSDLDEARQALGSTYADHEIHPRHSGPIRFQHWFSRVERLNLGSTNVQGDVRITAPPPQAFYILNLVTCGHVAVTYGRTSTVLTPGRGVAMGPTESFEYEDWSEDCMVFGVRINRDDLENDLEGMLGHPITRPVMFKFSMDLDQGEAAAFMRALELLQSELRRPDGMAQSEALAARMAQLARTALLVSQPHNYTDELTTPQRPAAPSTIQRAVELIEARPEGVVTVADLARAACLSVRAVEDGFKKHVGIPPMAYVREVRLARVHADLRAADAHSATVAQIAHRWGFAHLSRFTAAYRRKYGVLPSHTLRQGRA